MTDRALEIIKQYEGCKLTAYLCPAGVPTIGYGHTKGVKLGDTCSQEQAEKLLLEDYAEAQSQVKKVVQVPLTDNQLGALTSFVFNLGIRNLMTSTLLKYLNVKHYDAAADEFDKWVKCNGKSLDGLVKRRASEKTLFLS